MFNLTSIRIGTRLAISFVVIVMFLIIIAVISITSMTRLLETNRQFINKDVQQVMLAYEINTQAQAAALKLLEILSTAEREARIPLYQKMDVYNNKLSELISRLSVGNVEHKHLNRIINGRIDYEKAFIESVEYVELDRSLAYEHYKENTKPKLIKLLTDINSLLLHLQSLMNEKYLFSESNNQSAIVIDIILSGIAIILAAVLALIVTRSIVFPLYEIIAIAKEIAKGNYDTPVKINDSSELGLLAREFNHMKNAVVEREQKIIHNSYHDSLTDLPNRNRLFQILEQWSLENKTDHALFLIRIDHISAINESLGHAVGDQVIKVVSERLNSIEQVALLAHLRSDEFVLSIHDISKTSVIHWIDQVCEVLRTPYRTEKMTLHLQTNIGVSLSHESKNNHVCLLQMADTALQIARKQKQLFKLFDESLDVDQTERLSLINDLHNAISDKQLRLFYQPKLDLASGKVTHVEALIRWFHPEKGMIPPDKFIPIAESTGQIDNLTSWVLEEAARQYCEWKKQHLSISIAVNISAQNLKNDNMFDSVMSLFEQYELDVNAIHLEVTESAVVDDPVTSIALLTKFKDAGIILSIDDYGTGYSSLAQLKQLPVHELKIDMSFIQNLPDDEDDKIIVKSTIDLAHSMGLTVVAEGVETKLALEWLQENGCETIQGYYINKPLPADEFISWLKQSNYF